MEIRERKVIPERVCRRLLGVTAAQWRRLLVAQVLELEVVETGRGIELFTNIRSLERAARQCQESRRSMDAELAIRDLIRMLAEMAVQEHKAATADSSEARKKRRAKRTDRRTIDDRRNHNGQPESGKHHSARCPRV